MMGSRSRFPADGRSARSSSGLFSDRVFRGLWIAATVSYVGTWMQNIGAGWLMTSLTLSPVLLGLLQAAMSLPVFLVALPAGALADILDRRRLLLVTQISMVAISTLFGVLALLSLVTPWVVLSFTFLLGLGMVMNDPAWQAITPDIVEPRQVASAIALNSAAFNIARAVGPALGGIVIAVAGSGAAFLINAASFAGVIVFLLRWKSPRELRRSPRPSIFPAMRSGLEYLRGSRPLCAVLVRTGVFSLSASALWAMLPLVARRFGSLGYGTMLSCFGLGALAVAAALPRLRVRSSTDGLIGVGFIAFSIATLGLGVLATLPGLCAALFVGGAAWIVVVADLNAVTQTIAPSWVRARALSMYVLVLQGGIAAGSALWGIVAARTSIRLALTTAACAMALSSASQIWFPVRIDAGGLPATGSWLE